MHLPVSEARDERPVPSRQLPTVAIVDGAKETTGRTEGVGRQSFEAAPDNEKTP